MTEMTLVLMALNYQTSLFKAGVVRVGFEKTLPQHKYSPCDISLYFLLTVFEVWLFMFYSYIRAVSEGGVRRWFLYAVAFRPSFILFLR